jgi:hypothetical protein
MERYVKPLQQRYTCFVLAAASEIRFVTYLMLHTVGATVQHTHLASIYGTMSLYSSYTSPTCFGHIFWPYSGSYRFD